MRLSVFTKHTLAAIFGLSSFTVFAEHQDESFTNAEAFVHGYLYDGMAKVWNTDRRPWNQLLNVHACGGEEQEAKLLASYQANQPLFSDVMVALAEGQEDFASTESKAVLADVAQLAYRLFSASYAHGYAAQIQLTNQLDPGIQAELCGTDKLDNVQLNVEYPDTMNWQIDSLVQSVNTDSYVAFQQHAKYGYSAFTTLLASQRERFDALVYSHAYQNTDAYDQLFFEVNKYENVKTYQQSVDNIANYAVNDDKSAHADFAYLVLTSGYHWGTMSVLAMLEEEFPRLHLKAKLSATAQIERVTKSLKPIEEVESIGR